MIGSKTIQKFSTSLEQDFAKELRDQGHYLTGALEKSIESTKSEGDNNIALDVFANDYINPLNDSVPAERIPYNSDTPGRGKTSKYIEGLKRFAELRFGLDEKAALSAAFAIAKKHEKEGMPTQGSYAFTNNGRRTRSIEETYNQNEKGYDQLLEDGVSLEIDEFIDKMFDVTVF